MTVREITAPSVEPVSAAQAVDWLRAESADFNDGQTALLELLIQAMREHAETLTGRAFVQRTLELSLPCFPSSGVIVLPRPPLISVTSVKYYAFDGTDTTVDPTLYEVDTASEPGQVQPAYLETWEGTRNVFNAVRVRYEAGYAPVSSPTDYREKVPARLKLWVHARLATLWRNREQLVVGNLVKIPRDFADGMLDGLKVGNFFGTPA